MLRKRDFILIFFALVGLIALVPDDKEFKIPEDEMDYNYTSEIVRDPNRPNFIYAQWPVNDTFGKFLLDINTNRNWQRKTILPHKPASLYTTRCHLKGPVTKALFNTPYTTYGITMDLIDSNEVCDYQAAFGFAMKYDDLSHSIVEYLKQFSFSQQIGFYFREKQINDWDGELLIIGSQYNYLLEKKSRTANCKADESLKEWNCPLDGVVFGEVKSEKVTQQSHKIFSISAPVLFESIQRFILVPKDFMHFMKNNILDELIKEGKCSMVTRENMLVFLCQTDVVAKLPDIHFVINNFLISFEAKELFINTNPNEEMSLLGSATGVNQWIFGNIILKRYDLILDYHHHKIYMSDRSEKRTLMQINADAISTRKKVRMHSKELSFIIILMGIIGASFIIITQLSKKKKGSDKVHKEIGTQLI